ncbi:hypothetical protein HF072_05300 [Bacillus sp. RO3]|nr:hypothetical protein [Bacillus sp. RO3]
MNKRRILLLGYVVLLAGVLAYYWLYVERADSLPKEEEILSGIDSALHDADVTEIQDFLKVDDRHGVAPFRSGTENYGISYWEHTLIGWRVKGIRTDGDPKMWMVDGSDPSSFHIVWNMAPNNQVQTLKYYFLRERGYSRSGDQQHYVPTIMVKAEVSVEEASYGAMKLPKEWVYAMTLSDGSQGPDVTFGNEFHPGMHSIFGWMPVDEFGKEAEWMDPMNNSSYSTGDIREEYMQRVSKKQLEQGLY